MSEPIVIAVDVGGANLKFADDRGRRWSEPFELWKRCGQLGARLRQHVAAAETLLVTMTGELADCFSTRREGVQIITDHIEGLKIPSTWFYGLDGQFDDRSCVDSDPIRFAASNWHATATAWAGRLEPRTLIVDIGSTTTDLIVVEHGRIETTAKDDRQRLIERSLLYIGDRRTPVCGLVNRLDDRGENVPLMNEWFATVDDARLLLGHVTEDSSSVDSANGRPRTRTEAATRLLRMIGSDLNDHSIDEACRLAVQVHTAARDRIAAAIHHHQCPQILWLGQADDLIDGIERPIIRPAAGDPVDPCTAMLAIWRANRD